MRHNFVKFLAVAFTIILSAAQPSLAYFSPGETLNPSCTPSTSGCDVYSAVSTPANVSSSAASGSLMYSTGTTAWDLLPIGVNGQVLQISNGALSWQNGGGTYVAGSGLQLSGNSFSLNIPGLTTTTTIDSANDYIPLYSAASGTVKKVTQSSLLSGITGSLEYQGTWDASLAAAPGTCSGSTTNDYWIASAAGNGYIAGDWSVCNGTAWQKISGSSAVGSVFGRTGAVTASSGDYTATQITNTASGNITSTNVQSAINELDTNKLVKALSSGYILVGNASNQATGVAMSGDVTIDNTGATTIGTGKVTSANILDAAITDSDINSAAAITWTKISKTGSSLTDVADVPAYTGNANKILAVNSSANGLVWTSGLTNSLNSGYVLVGNASNQATGVAMSGDVTIDNTGATTIGSGKVDSSKILDGTIADGDVSSSAAITWTKISKTGSKLSDLDVPAYTGNSGKVLSTDGTSLTWSGGTGGSVGGSVSGAVSSATGGMLYVDSTGNLQQDSDFLWDPVSNKLTINGGGIDPVFFSVSDTANGAYYEAKDGQNATVSSANTGKLRYNASTQRWQISENGGAYVDLVGSNLSSALTSGHLFIGNASNQATGVAMSGDVTIDNTGATTIGSGKVDSSKILDGTISDGDVSSSAAIALSKLASGSDIVTSVGTPNASSTNGASIASNTLTLSFADASNPGILSTGLQTISGDKILTGNTTLNGSVNFTRTSSGQFSNYSDGTNTFGFYNTTTSPEGTLIANKGSLAMDVSTGTLYSKTSGTGDTGWIAFGAAGAGLTNLNGLTTVSQSFATGTAAGGSNDFNIVSSGSTHTFNIPNASATTRGALASSDWSTFNSKLSSILNSGNIFVGNGSDVATGVTVSGDATLSNTGALTIGNNAITNGKIANGAVSGTKLAMGSDAAGDILYYNGTQYTRLGIGTAGQALTVNSGATSPQWQTIATSNIYSDDGSLAGNRSVTLNGNSLTFLGSAGNLLMASTGDLTATGNISQTGATTFSTGTGNVSLNGNTTVTGTETVNSGTNNSLSLNRTSAGQFEQYSDGTNTFGFYNTTASPEGALVANKGSLAIDVSTGTLYSKTSGAGNTGWTAFGTAGAGLTNLNGLTVGSQSFATGTAAGGSNDFNIVSSGSTHTFNIPNASATTRGALTSTDWSTFNAKVGNTRQVTAGTGLTGGGALSADVTLSLDINNLAAKTSALSGDEIAVWDTSTSSIKKITRTNFLQGLTGSMTYQGTWNASTNTPVVADGTGTTGYVYVVATSGSQNLGSGSITFNAGDMVIYNGTIWQKAPSGANVASVFGRTGAVTASSGDYTALQIANTAAGNISATTVEGAINELDTEKLSTALQSGYVFVGDGSGAAAAVAPSGDVTITNAGVTTIANNAVTNGKIADGAVSGTKLAMGSDAAGDILYYNGTQYTRLGIGTSGQALTVNGGVPSWLTLPTANTIYSADGSLAGARNVALNGNSLTFTGSTGNLSISSTGDVSQTNATNFSTGTGNISFNGNATVAAGKNLTAAAGTGGLDWSLSTGTFKTSTGANTLGGNTTIAGTETVNSAAATSLTLNRTSGGQFTQYSDGTSTFGFYSTTGNPNGVITANMGSIAADTASGTLYQKTTSSANTGWVAVATVGSSVMNLNGATATTQTFATGSTGTDFNISTNTGTGAHTFNIPDASAANRGALTSLDWTTFNNKVGTSRQIAAGTGLAGGGDLSADRTLSLDVHSLASQSGSIDNADELAIWDSATSSVKKVSRSSFLSGVTGALTYQGTWDASTNTPALSDATGTKGQYYVVSVGGSQDLGSGSITFSVADWAVHNGTKWEKLINSVSVASVFGRTGTVTASSGDYTAAQITNTPSGGITATDVQAALNGLDTAKLSAALTSGNIIVGNASNVAAGVAMTGDIAITNAGVTTIANNAVTNGKIADGAVSGTKLAMGSDAAGDILYYNGTQYTRLGIGTAGQALTVNSGATSPQWQTIATSNIYSSDGTLAGNRNVTLGGNGLTFTGSTGNLQIASTGDLTATGNVSQTGATTFSTGTGNISLNGDTIIAAGKNLTAAAGAGSVDFSSTTGMLKTGTGAVTLNGNTTVVAGKTLTLADVTAGSLAFAGTGGVITQDNANLFWDAANHQLGIGTATPASTLTLNGSYQGKFTTLTANAALDDTYNIIGVNSTTGITITLPAVSVTKAGRTYTFVQVVDASSGTASTITAPGTHDTIGGTASTLTIGKNLGSSVTLVAYYNSTSTGFDWHVVSKNTVKLSDLAAAGAANTIDNTNYAQVWDWSTLAGGNGLTLDTGTASNLTTGTLVKINSASTAMAGAATKGSLLDVTASGNLAAFTGNLVNIGSTSTTGNVANTGNVLTLSDSASSGNKMTLLNLNVGGASADKGIVVANSGTGLSAKIQGAVALNAGTDFASVSIQNDAPFGNTSLIRITGSTAMALTGIKAVDGSNHATPATEDGRMLTLMNTSTAVVTLANLNSSSAVSNQIITGTAADMPVNAGASVLLVYDSTASDAVNSTTYGRWRVIGGSSSSSSTATTSYMPTLMDSNSQAGMYGNAFIYKNQIYVYGSYAYANVNDSSNGTTVQWTPAILPMYSSSTITPPASWKQIVGARTSACALSGDGTQVWCWGDNAHGQLGDNTTTTRYYAYPVQNLPSGTVIDYLTTVSDYGSSNAVTIFAVDKTNKKTFAWGNNSWGQIGIGSVTPAACSSLTYCKLPQEITTLTGKTILKVSVSGSNGMSVAAIDNSGTSCGSYAANTCGQLYTWGYNASGTAGNGTVTTPVTTPYAVTGMTTAKDVVARGNNDGTTARNWTIVLKADGTTWGAGRNGEGQLGLGNTTTPISTFTTASGGSAGVAKTAIFAGGYGQTVALDASGNIYITGSGDNYANGDTTSGSANRTSFYIPASLSGVHGAKVTIGGSTTGGCSSVFILDQNGDVWSAGYNVNGELGRGFLNANSNTESPIFKKVVRNSDGKLVVDLKTWGDSGTDGAIIVISDGTIMSTGNVDTGNSADINQTAAKSGAFKYVVGFEPGSKSTAVASTVPFSVLTNAIATGSLENLSYGQNWNWSTLTGSNGLNLAANALTSGSALTVSSSSAAATGNLASFSLTGDNSAVTGAALSASVTGPTSVATALKALNAGLGLGLDVQSGAVSFRKSATDYATAGPQDIPATTGYNSSLIRLVPTEAQIITGIAGGTDGKLLTLMNASLFTATIKNAGSATAANDIITGYGDLTLPAGASTLLQYDSVASVWRVIGGAGGANAATISSTSSGLWGNTSTVTVSGTTAETSMLSSGSGTKAVAANTLQNGSVIRVRGMLKYAVAGTTTDVYKLKLGSTVLGQFSPSSATVTSGDYNFDFETTITSSGATGTYTTSMVMVGGDGSSGSQNLGTTAPVTGSIDTAAGASLDVTYKAGTTVPSVTVSQLTIEILNAAGASSTAVQTTSSSYIPQMMDSEVNTAYGMIFIYKNQLYSMGLNDTSYTPYGIGGDSSSNTGVSANTNYAYTPTLVPVQSGPSGWSKVFGTRRSAIALSNDGRVYAWGNNGYGQLGDGTTTSRSYAKAITFPAAAGSIVNITGNTSNGSNDDRATYYAIDSKGQAWAWGDNAWGQCGDGTTATQSTPVLVNLPYASGANKVVKISVGQNWVFTTAVILQNTSTGARQLYTWGVDNTSGVLAMGNTSAVSSPTLVPDYAGGGTFVNSNVQDVIMRSGYDDADGSGSGTGSHRNTMVVLKGDGTVWSSGNNYRGQLADGTTTQRNYLVPATGLTGVTVSKIYGGDSNNGATIAAVSNTGYVYFVGCDIDGQMGDSTTTDKTSYFATSGAFQGKVAKVSIIGGSWYGGTSVYILDTDGNVWSSGYNYYGELGQGGTWGTKAQTFAKVVRNTDGKKVVDVHGTSAESSRWSAYITIEDGSMMAVGRNDLGQLGDNATNATFNSTFKYVVGFEPGSKSSTNVSSTTMSTLAAAVGINTIDNANNAQEWDWNTLSGENAFTVASTSTTASGNLATFNLSGNSATVTGNALVASVTGANATGNAIYAVNNGSGLAIKADGGVAFTKGSDYAAANQTTDGDLVAISSLYRLSGGGLTLNGIGGGSDGKILTLMNTSSSNDYIGNNASGVTGDSIITGTGGSLTLPAGASVLLVYDSGALVWRVVGGSGSSSTASNTADYISANRVTTDLATLGSGSDVIFNNTVNSANVTLNSTTGIFTLAGGKTFELEANPRFTTFSNTTAGYVKYEWVDSTNTPLANGTAGYAAPETSTTASSNQTSSSVIITTVGTTQVKLRITAATGTAILESGTASTVSITQLGSTAISNANTNTYMPQLQDQAFGAEGQAFIYRNQLYALGNGSSATRAFGTGTPGNYNAYVPTVVSVQNGPSGWVKVVGSNYALCALGTNNKVYCWGGNGHGELGDGTTTSRGYAKVVSLPADIPFDNLVTNIGERNYDGLSFYAWSSQTPNSLYAWGSGFNYKLGQGTDVADKSTPVQVQNLSGLYIIKVSAGGSNYPSLALIASATSGATSGQLYTWGQNASGSLGQNSTTNVNVPTLVPTGTGTPAFSNSNIKDVIMAGEYDTATNKQWMTVLKADGTVWGAGYNASGQLGIGNATAIINTLTKSNIVADTGNQIFAGGVGLTGVINSAGTIFLAGSNNEYAIGDTSDHNAYYTPTSLSGITASKLAIFGNSNGYDIVYVLTTSGDIYAAGRNEYGQLGRGTIDTSSSTQAVFAKAIRNSDGKPVVSLNAFGWDSTSGAVAVLSDGSMMMTGRGYYGGTTIVVDNAGSYTAEFKYIQGFEPGSKSSALASTVPFSLLAGATSSNNIDNANFNQTLTWNTLTTQSGMNLMADAMTTGSAFNVSSSSTTATGTVGSFQMTGNNAAVTGTALLASVTGNNSAATALKVANGGTGLGLDVSSGAVAIRGAQLYSTAGQTDNLVLANTSLLKLTSTTTAQIITGIAGGVDGRLLTIMNSSSLNATIRDRQNSTAGNQIATGYGDLTLPAGASVLLQYDSTSPGYWRVIGGSGSTTTVAATSTSSSVFENTGSVTISNTTTETTMLSSVGSGSKIIPANSLQAGSVIRVRGIINYAAPGTATDVFKLKLTNATNGTDTSIAKLTAGSTTTSGKDYAFDFEATVTAAGTVGTYTGSVTMVATGGATLGTTTPVTGTINTTAGSTIDLTLTPGATSVSATVSQATVEVLNATGSTTALQQVTQTSYIPQLSSNQGSDGQQGIIFIYKNQLYSVGQGRYIFGYENNSNLTTYQPALVPVQDGPTGWQDVVYNNNSACALGNNGEVYCWGYNGEGELGDGTTTSRYYAKQITHFTGSATVSKIYTANGREGHTSYGLTNTFYALASDGKLYAWGFNNWGQIGDGTTANKPNPVQVGTASLSGKYVIKLSTNYSPAGGVAVIAANSPTATSGQLYVWGNGDSGVLGLGNTTSVYNPTLVPDNAGGGSFINSGITDVLVRGAYDYNGCTSSCPTWYNRSWTTVLKSDGTIWGSGFSSNGMLGDGAGSTSVSHFVQGLTGVGTPLTNVAKIYADVAWPGGVTAAVTNSGYVYFAGTNNDYELGTASNTQNSYFAMPTAGTLGFQGKVAKVSIFGGSEYNNGGGFIYILDTDGNVWSAGYNGAGQLARENTTSGSTTINGTFQKVIRNTDGKKVVDMKLFGNGTDSGGGYSAAYITLEDGTMMSVGDNTYGELGNDSGSIGTGVYTAAFKYVVGFESGTKNAVNSSSPTSMTAIAAAVGSNTIDNLNNSQEWDWNTLTAGSGLVVASNSATATGTLGSFSLTGNNAGVTGTALSANVTGASSNATSFKVTNAGTGLGLNVASGAVAFGKGDYSGVGVQDNVSFANSSVIRMNGNGVTINGIAGGTDGKLLTLMNSHASAIDYLGNSASATVANNIVTGTGSVLSIPAGGAVLLVYDSGSSVWRVVGGSGSSSSTATTADYISANRITSDATALGASSDIVFNNSVNSSNVSLNITTGVFTLSAGKTYELEATPRFTTFSDTTTGYVKYEWVDSSNNPLAAGTAGYAAPETSTTASSNQPTASVIYTATTSTPVKLRITAASGTATLQATTASTATITQVGSSGLTSSSTSSYMPVLMDSNINYGIEGQAFIYRNQLYSFGYGAANRASGTDLNISNYAPTLVSVQNGPSGWIKVVGTSDTYCALGTNNKVYCWGNNTEGELGDGTTSDRAFAKVVSLPTTIPFDNLVTISGQNTSADKASFYAWSSQTPNSLYGWGYNTWYQLGNGNTTQQATPIPISIAAGQYVLKVSVSMLNGTSVAAIVGSSPSATSGSLYVWGWNGPGSLGINGTSSITTPSIVTANGGSFVNGTVKDVIVRGESNGSANKQVMFVLKADGTVWSAGYNADGQLGIGSTTNATYLTQVTGIPSDTGYQIYSTGLNSALVASDGTVYFTGNNSEYAIGDTSQHTSFFVPTSLQGVKASKVAMFGGPTGYAFNYVLTTSGEVYAAGRNNYGQLGRGSGDGGTNYLVTTTTGVNDTFAKVIRNTDGKQAVDVRVFGWDDTNAGALIMLSDGSLMTTGRFNVGGSNTADIDNSSSYTAEFKYVIGFGTGDKQTTLASTVTFNQIAGATSTTNLDNANATQNWAWSTLTTESGINLAANSMTSGSVMNVSSSSTAATGTVGSFSLTGDSPSVTGTALLAAVTGPTSSATALKVANSGTGLALDVATGAVAFRKVDYSITGATELPANTVAYNTSLIRMTGSTAQTINSIAGGYDGRLLTLMNASGNTLTIMDQSTSPSSAAANKIITGTGANLALASDASLLMQYDVATARWRVVGGTGAGTTLSIATSAQSAYLPTLTDSGYTTTSGVAFIYRNQIYTFGASGYANGINGTGDSTTPVLLPVSNGPTGWQQIVGVNGSYCALSNVGTVYCWGYNSKGQLGDGTAAGTSRFGYASQVTGFPAGTVISKIFANKTKGYTDYGLTYIALTSTGNLYAWGANAFGQLGLGTTTPAACSGNNYCVTPQAVQGLSGKVVTKVSISGTEGTAVAAVTSDGKLYVWGYNSLGQLGLGNTTSPITTPTLVGDNLGSGSFTNANVVDAIAASQNGYDGTTGYDAAYTVVLKSDGTVWSAGKNTYSQLGDGTTVDKNYFVQAKTASSTYLTNISKIYAADAWRGGITAAVDSSGNVWFAGDGVDYSLGTGVATNNTYFTQPTQGTLGFQGKVSKVELGGNAWVGYNTAYILDTDGNVWSAGQNSYGQLARGSTSATAATEGTFTKVIRNSDGVKVIDVKPWNINGAEGATIVLADGSLMTVGSAGSGQTGMGTTAASYSFMYVKGFEPGSKATTGIASVLVPFNSLMAASGASSADNGNYTQQWSWNSLTTSGLNITSNSTAATAGAQTLLNVALSGANATSSQRTYAMQIANSHSGTTSTNVGLQISSYAGTNNYALLVPQGSVGFSTYNPANLFSVSPTQYSTGTASQSGSTVTGSGTTFTAGMVGSQFVFADGTNAGAITAYTSATQVTVSTSQTVASQSYTISYTGLQVDASGRVGVGTASPQYALDVYANGNNVIARFLNGNGATGCSLSATGTLNCTSDQSLKKNVDTITFGIDDVMKLKPVAFNWNFEDDSASKSLGFVAQEVEQVIPQLVTTDEQTQMKQLNQIGLIPVLTRGLQQEYAELVEIKQMLGIGSESGVSLASLNQLAVAGALEVDGIVTLGKDTVGEAMLPAGSVSVKIAFSQEYTDKPAVVLTPEAQVFGSYWVTVEDGKGFSIDVSQSQTSDVSFSWHAFAQKGVAFSVNVASEPENEGSDNDKTGLHITSVDSINDISVPNGTEQSAIDLPSAINVTLSDGSRTELSVIWDGGTPAYDSSTAGTYQFLGTLTLPEDSSIINPGELQASVNVIVQSSDYESGGSGDGSSVEDNNPSDESGAGDTGADSSTGGDTGSDSGAEGGDGASS